MGVIENLFPKFALKREIARRHLDRVKKLKPQKRSFDALSGGRLYSDILAPKNSANSAIAGSIDGLRKQVRQLEYNNAFVAGPIKRIVNNVVGTGFKFQSRVMSDKNNMFQPKINKFGAENYNFMMERFQKRWEKQADLRLMQTFPYLVRTIEAALIRDGECLVIGRESKRRDRKIPYCLEVLEADRLMTPFEETNNPDISDGIIYDSEGVPKTYLVLKHHPGDIMHIGAIKGDKFEEIPAFYPNGNKKVMFLFNPMRPEQTRGFSAFASALTYYQNLDRYQEAEIFAAIEDACLTGIVTTEAPQSFQANYTEDDTTNDNRTHEFSPNKWHYMSPGEDVKIHAPSRPNTQFGEMTNQLLRGPANALDIPPEILTQNWQGLNYSNARTILLQFYLSCRIRQDYLIENVCIPAHTNVATNAVIFGQVSAPGFDRRKDDYMAHGWIPPGWQWVDPVKEANGKKVEVDNTFETLTGVLAGKGKDLDETLELRARELKKIKALEEEFDIKFNSELDAMAQAEPEIDDPEEPEEPEDDKAKADNKKTIRVVKG